MFLLFPPMNIHRLRIMCGLDMWTPAFLSLATMDFNDISNNVTEKNINFWYYQIENIYNSDYINLRE